MNDPFRDAAVARQRRRVGLWALAAKALLLAALVLAWWVWEQGGWRIQTAGALTPAVLVPGPAAETPITTAPRPPIGTAAPVVLAGSALAPVQAAASATTAPSSRVTELCGVGHVPADTEPPHLFEHAVQAAWPRVLAALSQSPAERARAAALALRFQLRMTDVQTRGQSPPSIEDPRTLLAAMASRSPDPAVFTWAWSLCQIPASPAACQQLSVARWIEQSPGQVQEDAAHWLLLATAEPAEAARAVRGMVRAPQYSPSPALTPWVASALPADLPPYLRLVLLLQVHGLDIARDATENQGLGAITRHCRSPSLDGAAAADCQALAETLEQRAPSLIGLALARRIGEVQGWPKERQDAVQARVQGLTRTAEQVLAADAAPLGCASVERAQQHFRHLATHGEVVAFGSLAAPAEPAKAASR